MARRIFDKCDATPALVEALRAGLKKMSIDMWVHPCGEYRNDEHKCVEVTSAPVKRFTARPRLASSTTDECRIVSHTTEPVFARALARRPQPHPGSDRLDLTSRAGRGSNLGGCSPLRVWSIAALRLLQLEWGP